MKKFTLLLLLYTNCLLFSQTNPAITGWLRNTTGIVGRHYVSGNSTPIVDAVQANVQTVQYDATNVYVSATGIPAYITGPFLDGNPTLATAQNKIFKFPLTPTQNTGTATATTGGNIGLFINGVALFDYRDGVSWKNSTSTICGGPIMSCTGDGKWNRDAVVGERGGFDCSKAHPAGGNYHHHQNPSAFGLDLTVISTVCSTYPSDGLYVINSTQHSPLLGFAYDGFPIYGAYAYANVDGTGGIVRMKSSYQYRNITTRTVWADGTDVLDGPAVSTIYPLGYFREDYEFIAHPTDASYLDIHNGRFCVTPEYPAGIYCYFTTVDANHNSAYPYAVGPTFYGNKVATTVTTVPTGTTTYVLANETFNLNESKITIYPNPASNFIAIQTDLVESDMNVDLIDELGKVVKSSKILQGSTLSVIETDDIYNGVYFIRLSNSKDSITKKVIINK
ncbi:YHYH protein [Flavobacterium sp. SUN052]|uniref:YHYH protein n=1 Tax=Flavobacterium sp. SUN052 TaxID=3002441 RepID=UPI00237D5E58|nr:YHYH protein [Flavobacterium sp. SUN052]MEC4003477.1 YHYH protein [Flavobacterium sp. SUN052]